MGHPEPKLRETIAAPSAETGETVMTAAEADCNVFRMYESRVIHNLSSWAHAIWCWFQILQQIQSAKKNISANERSMNNTLGNFLF